MEHATVAAQDLGSVMHKASVNSRRKFKSETSDEDEKRRQEEAEPGRNSDVEKVRREKIRDGESQRREDAGARKGREVAKHCVFPMFCGSGGSKSRVAKAAGAETSGQMRKMKNCTPLWREARLEVKMYKAHDSRTTFGS